MQTYQPVLPTTIEAAAAITAKRFVGFGGQHCGANEKALGVSEVGANQGEACPVIAIGIALVEAGGAFSAGAEVASDANGKAVEASDVAVSVDSGATQVTSTAANGDITTVSGGVLPQKVNGEALDDSSGDGDIVRVLLR